MMKFSRSNTFKSLSAYGGKGFISRKNEDWITVDSEYSKLQSVALYIPGSEVHKLKNPKYAQHLDQIDSGKLKIEIEKVIKFFENNSIKVEKIPSNIHSPPNLVFMRDLFWSTSVGITSSRMGSEIRKPEDKIIAQFLIQKNLPLTFKIPSPHTFEAADCLWLNKKTLLIGINNRTSKSVIKFIKCIFPTIKIIPVKLPKDVQHLLGLLNIIDKKKALFRHQIAPKTLLKTLQKEKFHLIYIDETEEVRRLQGMNIVTIKPNHIIMPDDCPNLEMLYKKNKIKIVKKFEINELRKAAGGLACMVGILKRSN